MQGTITKSEAVAAGWLIEFADIDGNTYATTSHHATEAEAIEEAGAVWGASLSWPVDSEDAEQIAEARQAAADAIQSHIDGDAKLSTVDGLSVEVDDTTQTDVSHVLLVFPSDADPATPFWKGAHATIVNAYGGKAVDANTVRVRKDKAISHLDFIAAMLPDPV
jgi:hypothetical protein